MTEEEMTGLECIKNFIRLELKIKGALASIQAVPRNEALEKAFGEKIVPLQEQTASTWANYMHNIPAYENALQSFITAEENYYADPDYFHNNMGKMLAYASDIRDLYDDAVNYLKRKSAEPEFNNILVMTRNLVNTLLDVVINLVEIEEKFKANLDRMGIDYIEKYNLHEVQ